MSNLIRMILVFFGVFAALTTTAATARNVAADVDQIAAVMKAGGKSAVVKSAGGERYVLSETAGHQYAILALGCNDDGNLCKSVQFFVALDPEKSPTFEAMNGFARELRWGRVYLDQEGEPVMEFDLDLERGGISQPLFLDNVAKWESIVSAYAKFVFGK
ncbi:MULTISPECIES: YbjN domain-containing protein [unclassified Novosphingobium]|uniref:YbjN domain-containing protein n=1 Tax=unclassified Novosphingobium TaxID=2644732 RepID=UPI0025F9A31C|nr:MULTISPECIES: YbjN domain-containing protein [unclassified Novosphingobium]HQV02628.1 YbjN domain-containing protein [Novosphingobium sp.]